MRLFSPDGDPIPANAIFFVNRSSEKSGLPEHIAISNLDLTVPNGTDGYGVLVAGSDAALTNLTIQGSPLDAVSVTIDSNSITDAGNAKFLGRAPVSYTGPWAGIDIEPDTVDYPIKNVTVSNNTIADNGDAGILMALATNSGLPKVADLISLKANAITRNALGSGPFLRGGICLQGGQANGKGNSASPRTRSSPTAASGSASTPRARTMKITLSKNTIKQNTDGDSAW